LIFVNKSFILVCVCEKTTKYSSYSKRRKRNLNYTEAERLLTEYNQQHVLADYDTLSADEQKNLLMQIGELDFSVLEALNVESGTSNDVITPNAALQLGTIKEKEDIYKAAGIKSIKNGELALVLLAGGQGTRLGFDGPKGTYNVGITHDLFIFECLINNTLDVVKLADAWIHFYIMTSDKNYDETKAFFETHNYFGYEPSYIHFFKQEMVPSVDFDGRILKESPSCICMSPNGNGGWFSSLDRAGYLDEILADNIKYINVFSVDNVLQRIADPVFLGAIITEGYESGGKVVKKANPDERVGTLCMKNGRPYIVEYYELTPDMRDERDENGDYAYNYGVTLNYIFPVEKLMTLLNEHMPLHIVKKVIPYMNEQGELVKPSEPNGFKFETLALDMLGFMDNCLPYEIVRDYEFAPIKNSTGQDSVETARELLVKNGVEL
jgi:UDP-N-acetylglucosamine/UDP-N-acetylgalactosamine diphosphorylase